MADLQAASPETDSRPWYRQLSGKHWFILIVCTLGWALDTLNQQLFALAKSPAIAGLTGMGEWTGAVSSYAAWATALMLIGWATGGIIFGVCGDKYGRVRTMFWMILLYSVASGVTCFVKDVNQFLALRFISGLGFGGAFAVCATVVAESMPASARPYALAFLQAMSSLGNITAALIAFVLGQVVPHGGGWGVWNWTFFFGFFPVILLFFIRTMDEPEAWKKAHEEAKEAGRKASPLAELFGNSFTRNRVILGMIFASIGIIGFWGIMLFAIDLNRSVFRYNCETAGLEEFSKNEQIFFAKLVTDKDFAKAVKDQEIKEGFFMNRVNEPGLALSGGKIFKVLKDIADGQNDLADEEIVDVLAPATDSSNKAIGNEEAARIKEWIDEARADARQSDTDELIGLIKADKSRIDKTVSNWGAITSALINLGAFFGMYAFALITRRIGRRPTFVFFLLAAMCASLAVFGFARTSISVLILNPLMGFSVASLLSGYTIYFPELFPTRVRSTSVSLCYNAGRYISAIGPFFIGFLTSSVYAHKAEPMAWAGATLCPIFLLGIILIFFLPETKDQPLPE
ncbi:MAG: MFS transporter [Thermoguttaceae bacterium]|nr:MFS transporter [Thermoguttaceae bacterium]